MLIQWETGPNELFPKWIFIIDFRLTVDQPFIRSKLVPKPISLQPGTR